MQDIKFRAWDKWNNQYFENFNNIFITGNGEIGVVDKSGHNLIEEYQERFVSEFSTGLKDKNGVDVYEGDIISASVYGFQETGLVEYSPFGEWVFGNIRLNEFMSSLTVIGNIHENADLLSDNTNND